MHPLTKLFISQGVPYERMAKSAKVFFMIDFYSSKDA